MLKEKKIHIGIDASNISSGGGLTHLQCLLSAVKADDHQFNKITIWTGQKTSASLPVQPWLEIKSPKWIHWPLILRTISQYLFMPQLLREAKVDLLFIPGGAIPYKSPFPLVTMSQNMLPFEPLRANLFGKFSLMRLKILLLFFAQFRTFERARGIIYLTKYAQETVRKSFLRSIAKTVIIPHGIEERFLQHPRPQRPYGEITSQKPFKIVYVSILMPYKHQIEVAYAISYLRSQGFPVEITFVGSSWGSYGKYFLKILKKIDVNSQFLHFEGHLPFQILHEIYQQFDCFLFASSCENLPNILIEAMAAGIPIACSNRGPMPEVLGEAGIYFDPEEPESISAAILNLAKSVELRKQFARSAWLRAQEYSWEKCANDTFSFIFQVANQEKSS